MIASADQWTVAPGWEELADEFARIVDSADQGGAAVALYLDGRLTVSAWGGVSDAAGDVPWREDTAAVVFSCTKGLTAILAARLVQEGRLDYDAPVSRYWPEFARAGKGYLTVSQLLAHRAGLPALAADLSPEQITDRPAMVRLLEEQPPLWDPGTRHSYHPITYGWLVGELLARAAGEDVGSLLHSRVTGPLGAHAWIGFDEPPATIATILTTPSQELAAEELARSQPSWPYRAMTLGGALPATLAGVGTGFNDPRILAAGLPGAGGIATAEGLARIWSSTVATTDGVRVLDDDVLATATAVQSEGPQVAPSGPPWARFARGFQLRSEQQPYPSGRSFGHDGAGGQSAFADPENRLGFAFVTNSMGGGDDTRSRRLLASVERVVRGG